jgi:putative methanogenesis marker protein 8
MPDRHTIRYFTSVITVSRGKVWRVTTPAISSCPLASRLYKGFKAPAVLSKRALRSAVRGVVEGKIRRFGFFTDKRVLAHDGQAIPYGASEIIVHGLKSRCIDSAVMVCDGAGTVVVRDPATAQGIGARMHTILSTSPIQATIRELRQRGCGIVSSSGAIDQAAGVVHAAKAGCRKIAVTVNAYHGEGLKNIRIIERHHNVSVTILMVCTTGISVKRIKEMERYADIVWSCHSDPVRIRMEQVALKRLSGVSPVYVLTDKGMKLVSGYDPNVYGIRREMRRP